MKDKKINEIKRRKKIEEKKFEEKIGEIKR